MDNSINLPNYNIDYFQSINLGPITDGDFLTYLLTHNLPQPNPIISTALGGNVLVDRGAEYDVSQSIPNVVDVPDLQTVATEPSIYNNFSAPLDANLERNASPDDFASWYPGFGLITNIYGSDYGVPYGVPETLRIRNVGNVDSWAVSEGLFTTTHDIRDIQLFSKTNNKYGPSQIIQYSNGGDQLVDESTGFIQYSDFVAGDFRDQIFNRTLGVGVVPFATNGSGINFLPDGQNISELDRIARKRRGQEVASRIKLNFVDNTVGSINTSPFTLLAGGNIIEQDFKITRPASFLGKAAEFLSNLAGFTLPRSILTDGDLSYFTYYPGKASKPLNSPSPQNVNEVDIQEGLLNRTGKPTRDIVLDTVGINKYGPTFNGDYEKLNQGTYVNTPTETNKNGPIPNTSLNFDPSIPNGMSKGGGFYGKFEPYESVNRVFSEDAGFSQENGIAETLDFNKDSTTYQGTPIENFNVTPDQTGTINEKLDWRKRDSNPFKKGILKYTQDIINNSKLTDPGGYIGYFDSAEAFKGKKDYQQSVDGYGHYTGTEDPTSKPTRESRGNTTRNIGVTTEGKLQDGAYYCRSWSSRRKYHTYNNLVRNDVNWWGGTENNKNMTMNWDSLHGGGKTNMPKIAPNADDIAAINRSSTDVRGTLIPYMLSIENLAWKDAPQILELPDSEIGPNGGRIMWFPPYGINFSENNSVNWDSTSFIGRGENIYTYNNTERSGTLDFMVVVDHPNILNRIRDDFSKSLDDQLLHSFFAGCDAETLKEYFKNYLPKEKPSTNNNAKDVQTVTPKEPQCPPADEWVIYFENSRTASKPIGRVVDLDVYEVTNPSTDTIDLTQWQSNGSVYPCGPASGNTYSYLNKDKAQQLQELAKFLITEDGKNYTIKIVSSTSPSQLGNNYNQKLAEDRANSTKKYLFDLMTAIESDPPHLNGDPTYPSYPTEQDLQASTDRWSINPKPKEGEPYPYYQDAGNPCYDGYVNIPLSERLNPAQANARASKLDRFARITLEKNQNLQTKLLSEQNAKEKEETVLSQKLENEQKSKDDRDSIKNLISKYFVTEDLYFEKMKKNSPFIYNSLSEKIKYFHPAFHSMTPEGLNSRLTFLSQCTRQGPQIIDQDAPQNMVFGRPPICVLRIGDFYHTKIVIDSINISYDPLQWDLNPEGVGVQPMIAKVSMSFKFIGGSSLGGPISQLQNAVSYNFFANTSVYNPAYTFSLGEQKLKYVYGSFTSPEDATSKISQVTASMDEIQKQDQQNKKDTVNTSPDNTKNAQIDNNTQNNIEDFSQTSTVPGTPPVPPDLERMKVDGELMGSGTSPLLFVTVSVSNVQTEDNFDAFQGITPETPGYQQLINSGQQLSRYEPLSKSYNITYIEINNTNVPVLFQTNTLIEKESTGVDTQAFFPTSSINYTNNVLSIAGVNVTKQSTITVVFDSGDKISGPLKLSIS